MNGNEHDPRFAISRNLQRLMQDRGVSVDELEARTELSRRRIAQFSKAEAEPTARDLLRLASALDTTVEQLLEGINWRPDGEGGGEIWIE